MPSPVPEERLCVCGHHSRNHDDWPICALCNCTLYHEEPLKNMPIGEMRDLRTEDDARQAYWDAVRGRG